jgi:hypothetical protein
VAELGDTNGLDYVLDPVTVQLMSDYANGNDQINNQMGMSLAVEGLVEKVTLLDDYTKGIVIIDLLTLNDCLSQAITLMNLPRLDGENQ